MIINGKNIKTKTSFLELEDVAYYQLNPRANFHFVKQGKDPKTATFTEIHNFMKNASSVTNILQGFKKRANKYTGDSIIVCNSEDLDWTNSFRKKYIVIEGNSRLRFFHLLQETNVLDETEKNSFKKVKAEIIQDKITEEDVDAYLSSVHVTQKTPWAPESQAYHFKRRLDTPDVRTKQDREKKIQMFCKETGLRKNTIKTNISAVEILQSENDTRSDHFEHYRQVVAKMSDLVEENIDEETGKYDPRIANNNWKNLISLIKDNEVSSTEIRDKLAPIYEGDNHLFKKVINGTKKLKNAHKEFLAGRGPDMALDELEDFNEFIGNITSKDIDNCERDPKTKIWNRLEDIMKRTVSLYNIVCDSLDKPNKKRVIKKKD